MSHHEHYVEHQGIKFPKRTEHPSRLKRYAGLRLHAPVPGLATSRDLTNEQSRVLRQGGTNACTLFATCAALEHLALKNKQDDSFSELFLFYAAHVHAHVNPAKNEGVFISSAVATAEDVGVCLLNTWNPPGNLVDSIWKKPSNAAYNEAACFQVIEARHFDASVEAIKQMINADNPIIVSFAMTDTYYATGGQVWRTGVFPLGGPAVGAHSVLIVGYDDTKRRFKLKNSWGTEWGENGYGYLPYDYRLYEDCWVILKQEYNNVAPAMTDIEASGVFKRRDGMRPKDVHSRWKLEQAFDDVQKAQLGFHGSVRNRTRPVISPKTTTIRSSGETRICEMAPVDHLQSVQLLPLSNDVSAEVDEALTDSPTVVVATQFPKDKIEQAREMRINVDNGQSWLAGLCSQQVQSKIDGGTLPGDEAFAVSGYYALCKDYYIRNAASSWLSLVKDVTIEKTYEESRTEFHTELISDVMTGLVLNPTVTNALEGILQTISNTITTANTQNGSFHITLQIYNWSEDFEMMEVMWRTIFFKANVSVKEFVTNKVEHEEVKFKANLNVTDYRFNLDIYEKIQDSLNENLVERGKEQVQNAENLAGPDLAPPPY